MGGLPPFSEEERASIERAAQTLIWGENVTGPVQEDVERWNAVIKLYLSVVDSENGAMHVLPYEGGLLNQPWRTMQVFEVIQSKFQQRLKEENESMERNLKKRH
jgi:hypothetical protein